MTAGVEYRVEERIARIGLARPPANVVDHELIDGLLAALATARRDDGVRVVILESALQRVFCGGMDLKLVVGATAASFRAFLEKVYVQLYEAQHHLGKPTIAVLDGAARGAGVTLASSCDLIVASDQATLGYPEIDVGLLPGIHYVHVPRQVTRSQAFELLFLGKPISATRALELGLINRVVPKAQLTAEVDDIASQLASKAPGLMRVGRNTFYRMNDQDYRRSIESIVDTLSSIIESEESQQRLRSFFDKSGATE